MTVRQFLSIIINSYVFAGSNASISPIAWMGIGIVAAGLFIKMDRRDHGDAPPKKGGSRAEAGGSGRGGRKVGEEKESLISMQSEPSSPTGSPGRSSNRRGSDFDTASESGLQYGRRLFHSSTFFEQFLILRCSIPTVRTAHPRSHLPRRSTLAVSISQTVNSRSQYRTRNRSHRRGR